jgi:hypothetical protein
VVAAINDHVLSLSVTGAPMFSAAAVESAGVQTKRCFLPLHGVRPERRDLCNYQEGKAAANVARHANPI